MNVELHIETLVLPAGSDRDRERIASSLQEELHRLLLEGGPVPALREGADIAHVDGGAVHVDRDAAPGAVAAGIARAVHQGVSRA